MHNSKFSSGTLPSLLTWKRNTQLQSINITDYSNQFGKSNENVIVSGSTNVNMNHEDIKIKNSWLSPRYAYLCVNQFEASASSQGPPAHLNFWRLVCPNPLPQGQKLSSNPPLPFLFLLKVKSVTVTLYTLTKLYDWDLVDFSFWAIRLRKWTSVFNTLKRLHI